MGQKMPAIRINLESTPQTPAWYTVVTKFNYEKKFASDVMAGLKNSGLNDYVFEVIVPFRETEMMTKTKTGKDKKTIRTEKIYPLYVFVKAIMTEQVWNYLRNTTGAATILASGPSLLIMSDNDIKQIKNDCGLDKEEEALKKQKRIQNVNANKFQIDQSIKIADGILKGYVGKIKSIDLNKNKINALIDGLNVEVKMEDIELL